MLINSPSQVKYGKIYLRDTTLISPFPMLLFGGDIDIQHREKLITLDGWINFQVRAQRVAFKKQSKTMDGKLLNVCLAQCLWFYKVSLKLKCIKNRA